MGGAAIAATAQSFSATSLDVAVPQLAVDLAAAGTVFNINVANPAGGSMTLSNAFTMAGPVLTDVNGGLSGSGTVNSVFIIDGNNFVFDERKQPRFALESRALGGGVYGTRIFERRFS